MDLFEANRRATLAHAAPLSARMRPRNLAEIVGHEDVIGEGTLLRQAIERDQLISLVLWGPPGSGKTTLARLIANETRAHFVAISAVSSGVAELRSIVREAADRLGMHGQRTVLFIDEIHRFNKAQQDAILPYVEDGTVILIGATTENPSFEVNAPLLSRSRVVVLQALDDSDIETIITRAMCDDDRGLGIRRLTLPNEARSLLVNLANGDARFALNTLEFAAAGSGRRRARSMPSACFRQHSAARPPTISRVKHTLTLFRHCTRRCEAPIPTPRSIGWHGCWSEVTTRSMSHGAWCDSRRKTSDWPSLTPFHWRLPRNKPCTFSGCPKVRWLWRNLLSTSLWLRRAMPSIGRIAKRQPMWHPRETIQYRSTSAMRRLGS